MRPDPRQLRRVSWLPPLRLTLLLPPPPASLSPEHLRELNRAHARRRVLVGVLSAMAIGALAAGSVTGVSAAAVAATGDRPGLGLGAGQPAGATDSGWLMLPGDAGKGRDTLPGATTSSAAGQPRIDASDITDIGIPEVALDAYRTAEAELAVADPSCRIDWSLVAGIGKVESSHGQYGGRQPGVDGSVAPPILGIPLDGRAGVALIRDTDNGRLDYDTVYDRAVGPMQFIPGTWAQFPDADGDGNGSVDPHNLYDAALAAGSYLCSGPGDLSTVGGQRSAVYRYNHSDSYVDLVLAYAGAYADGVNPTGPDPRPAGPPPNVPRDPITDPAHPPTSPPRPTNPPPSATPPTSTPPSTTPPSTTPPSTTPPSTSPPSTTPTSTPPDCSPSSTSTTPPPTESTEPTGPTSPSGTASPTVPPCGTQTPEPTGSTTGSTEPTTPGSTPTSPESTTSSSSAGSTTGSSSAGTGTPTAT